MKIEKKFLRTGNFSLDLLGKGWIKYTHQLQWTFGIRQIASDRQGIAGE
jgi:hypothetical protein